MNYSIKIIIIFEGFGFFEILNIGKGGVGFKCIGVVWWEILFFLVFWWLLVKNLVKVCWFNEGDGDVRLLWMNILFLFGDVWIVFVIFFVCREGLVLDIVFDLLLFLLFVVDIILKIICIIYFYVLLEN